MGFRFRKSVGGRAARVNLSRGRGVSFSFGGRGSTTSISSRGIRQTFSIPGTGISYSTSTGSGRRKAAQGGILNRLVAWVIVIALIRWGWTHLTQSDSPPMVAQTVPTPAHLDNALHKAAAHKTHVPKVADSQPVTPQAVANTPPVQAPTTAAAADDSAKIGSPDFVSDGVATAAAP